MNLFELDLGGFGAQGFSLNDRLDMTGHRYGQVDPHLNSDLAGPGGQVLRRVGGADFRDLTHNQLPGFNGMQSL